MIDKQIADFQRKAEQERDQVRSQVWTRESVAFELQRRINAEYAKQRELQPEALVCPHCGGMGWVTLDIDMHHPNPHLAYYFGKAFPCPCSENVRAGRQMDRFELSYSLPEDHKAYTLDVWRNMPERIIAGKELGLAAVEQYIQTMCTYGDSGKEKPWLVFSGEPGKGKTSLACALAMALIAENNIVQWTDFNQFIDDVQSTYSDDQGPARADLINVAQTVPVLFLDDLGDVKRTTPVSDDKRDILYSVLRHRTTKLLPTVITTNLSKEQFEFQFGERISSRVRDLSTWITVSGLQFREK